MAKILIPTPLRPYTDKKDAVDANGATVGELLADVPRKISGLKTPLYNDQGKLRSFVNVYVNDEDIRYLQKEQTPVKPEDPVSIFPWVAGGVEPAAPAPPAPPRGSALTNDEYKRYSRHLIMPEVGLDGQLKLKAAKVLCIGAGGLGSPVAMYLTAAGVGTLGIVDFDVVDFSNLQRQILHGTPDVGRSKLASAKDRLQALNPNVDVVAHETAISSENALKLFEPYDVIVDGLWMRFRELKLRKDPDCPVCGTHPTVTQLIDYEQFCGVRPAAPEPITVNSATEITSVELKQRLDRGDKLKIVDVREPNEYQINRIPGSELIPLGDVPKRVNELNPDDEIVVHRKTGGRSAKAADFLRSVGFKKVLNLKGGVLDWIDKVDPTQPKY